MLDINNPVNPFGRAHPVLIVGIFIYLGYFFVSGGLKEVCNWLGIACIAIGSIASIYNISQGV